MCCICFHSWDYKSLKLCVLLKLKKNCLFFVRYTCHYFPFYFNGNKHFKYKLKVLSNYCYRLQKVHTKLNG